MKPRNRKGFGASSFAGFARKFRPNEVRISTCGAGFRPAAGWISFSYGRYNVIKNHSLGDKRPFTHPKVNHIATLYAARSTGSRIILCNRVVSQLTLLHHSLRLCRPAGLKSRAQLCCGRVVLQMKTRQAARVKGQTGVCPVKDENTPCGV